jgi:EAL domain-containing protein (putative c-di-GMP-specific phosphodiesterase class I)
MSSPPDSAAFPPPGGDDARQAPEDALLSPVHAALERAARHLEGDLAPAADIELARAVLYIVNRFRDEAGNRFTLEALAGNLDRLAADAIRRLVAFRRLVGDGSFETAFQPIVELATGQAHHYEALVRFDRRTLDVAPAEFITFAEDVGLIHEFDLAMCRKVLEFLAADHHPECTVAVNLSAGSLDSPAFRQALPALLTGFEGVRQRLAFEVTETAKIADLTTANAFIQGLRRDGHTVCLDDFGAGSAAFQYLRALQVDAVKIDGGYIKNARQTSEGARFLKAMTWLIHELEIDTIAEMVEDEAHLEAIRACRITYGQGYMFGRPSTDIRTFAQPPALAS